jgi:hypothetical protein
MWIWPRRHRYHCIGQRLYANYFVSIYHCYECGHEVWLERDQIRSLPWHMAKCPNGRRLTILEFLGVLLTGDAISINCYDPKRPVH